MELFPLLTPLGFAVALSPTTSSSLCLSAVPPGGGPGLPPALVAGNPFLKDLLDLHLFKGVVPLTGIANNQVVHGCISRLLAYCSYRCKWFFLGFNNFLFVQDSTSVCQSDTDCFQGERTSEAPKASESENSLSDCPSQSTCETPNRPCQGVFCVGKIEVSSLKISACGAGAGLDCARFPTHIAEMLTVQATPWQCDRCKQWCKASAMFCQNWQEMGRPAGGEPTATGQQHSRHRDRLLG